MRTLSPADKAKRIAVDSMLLAAALIFSYVESLLPSFVPIPGIKLGLANAAVMFSVYFIGIYDAVAVNILRVTLNAVLFGSVSSFFFSLSGALLSLIVLVLFKRFLFGKLSFIGISVGSSAAHNVGQISAAAVIFGEISVFYYLPWLLAAAVITGIITGAVMMVFSKNMRKILPFLLIAFLLFTSCARREYADYTFFSMDTVISFHAEPIAESIYSECENYVNSFNKSIASPDELIEKAAEIRGNTNGAFDYELGELIKLWDIPHNTGRIPAQNEIDKALSDKGIDLGGICKGFACGKVIEKLKSAGASYGLVSFGGNVGVFGSKPNGEKWVIGVKDPRSTDDVVGYLHINEGFVSVSGDYERYFEADGIRYHHIFDSESGYPADSGVQSVAVWGKNGAEADALSTALFVMGVDKGMEFYSKGIYEFEALFITDEGIVLTEKMGDYFNGV